MSEQLIHHLKARVESIKIGDPTDPETQLGPLVSKRQYDKVMGMIARGKEAGAQVLTGGDRPANVNENGLFVAPTVFTDVSDSMEIWNEEIFGPVLCVMECESMDDAIAKANKSKYALGGAVITNNVELKEKAVSGLRCGIVWVDCS